MKAVYFEEHGGPEKLIFGDRPDPNTGPDEVLVRVKACALNRLDVWMRLGIPGLAVPLPHIPGSDVAGIIEIAGSRVADVTPGQRVIVAPGLSCGRCDPCKTGRDHLCPAYDILGQTHDGGYAQYVAVPAGNVIPLPDDITFEEAAAFPLTFLTAWHMLANQARLQKGETVLIQSGASGLGSAAIQIARLLGGRICATAGTDDKAAKTKGLGAEVAINYSSVDFLKEVRDWTEKRGVDVVFEHVGADTFEKSLSALARGGRLVICGATSGRNVSFDLRALFGRNISVLGSRMGPQNALRQAYRHFLEGRLDPVVDKVFPLEDAAEAHVYMEERKNFGKIVLKVE